MLSMRTLARTLEILTVIKYHNFPYDFSVENFISQILSEPKFRKFQGNKIHIYGSYPKLNSIYKTYIFLRSRNSDKYMSKWLENGYGIPPRVDEDAFNIWITFENRRPLIEKFDLCISFDSYSYNNKNYYLPLLYFYINLDDKIKNVWKYDVVQSYLLSEREMPLRILKNKNRDMCAFVNNPHPIRMNFINLFKNNLKLDEYGRHFGNYVPQKVNKIEQYWMNLCFENDLYPGYVTEKILEAWLGYSVPIYWGWDSQGILNSDAFINLANFVSDEEFVKSVCELIKDKTEMINLIKKPLIKKSFDLKKFTNFLYEGLARKFAEK